MRAFKGAGNILCVGVVISWVQTYVKIHQALLSLYPLYKFNLHLKKYYETQSYKKSFKDYNKNVYNRIPNLEETQS